MPREGKDRDIPSLLHFHPGGSDKAGIRVFLWEYPTQMCPASCAMQMCSTGCPPCAKRKKKLLNGEHGGNQGKASTHGKQAGETAWPGRARAKPRLAPADADAPCGAAPKRAWHSWVPLEPMPEGHGSRCLMKWDVKGMFPPSLALSPP